MRAMVVEAFGRQPRLKELPDPVPTQDEVLVRVRAAGVCHTDLKIRDGHVAGVSLPLVLGHEIAGEVTAVGPAVTSVAVGEVGVPYGYVTCGSCRFCVTGQTSLCVDISTRYGFGRVGGYSEYVLVPERFFLPIPDGMSPADAAVASCSVVTPYRALVKRARLRVGESVVVIGAGGGLGLHAVQLAHRMGARTFGVDSDARRESDILSQGADQFLVSGSDGFARTVRETLGGRGADVVLDLVAAPATMREAVASLDPGGRLVLVGSRPDADFGAVTGDLVYGEIEVYGSHWASLTDLREVLELVARGRLEPVILREFQLDQAPDALDLLASGAAAGRSVLTI